ncbi:MAG: glycosyltransferase [Bacteroidetes bacterium]|nr:glycosyltransferase [Bacteroidota bacterium]
MNRPKKILLTIRQGKIGGGESHVLDLVRNLDRTKYEPVVLSFTEGPMIDALNSWGVRTQVISTEQPFNFLLWKKVKDFIANEQVELIHAHGTRANSNVFYAARRLNLPLIYTVHGWSFHQDQNLFVKTMRRLGERFLVNESDLTICVSNSNLQDGKASAGVRRFELVNYGIDLEKFNPERAYPNLRAEFGVKDDETLVGYIARITVQKDPHTLIRAIAEVINTTSKIKFLIVGSGELKESTIQLAKELAVENYIIFQDFRTDTPAILANVDIYCLPSLWEGLPIGLLEAMAMKKAIVATPVDGTKEAIQDGYSGLLVPHQSPHKLATAILQLHEDRSLRYRLGLQARLSIEQRFEVKRMAAETQNIYARFLSTSEKRPLRIGIEAQRLFRKKKHGLEIVALEVIKHLQEIDTYNQYIVFVRRDVDRCIQPKPNFQIREISASSFPIWEQIKFPLAIKKEKLDVLHCTANTAPLFTNVPIVLTLHDVIFLEGLQFRGNYYQNLGNIYRRFVVQSVISKVKKVVTVSEWERHQIQQHLRINNDRIQVIYNAVDRSFRKIDKSLIWQARAKYQLPDQFILFFGNTAEKKNTHGTISAYVHYAKNEKNPLPLVLAGAFEHYLKEQVDVIDPPLEIRSLIKIIGYIPFVEQPLLYNAASLFLYTSKRESFGLPILESMACGTPVITSNTSSMPEVTGDAAPLVDPQNTVEIAEAISKVLNNEAMRNDYISRGLARAQNFSWNRAAVELQTIYSDIASQKK